MAGRSEPISANNTASRMARAFAARVGANWRAAWSGLRRPGDAPLPRHELHRLHWLFWSVMAVIAVLQVAKLFDARSVAWHLGLPDWLAGFFAAVTDIGQSQWYLVPAGIVVLLLLFGDWRGMALLLRAAWLEIGVLAAYAFFAIGGAGIVTNIVKQLVGRGRPVLYPADGWLTFDAFQFDYANGSFPSGHATTAGAAIIVGALIFPRFRLPIILAGLLVTLSRVGVGAHYPSDVVAGLSVGIAFAYLTARFLLRRRVGFELDGEGRIRPRLAAAGCALRRTTAAFLAAPFRALAGSRDPSRA